MSAAQPTTNRGLHWAASALCLAGCMATQLNHPNHFAPTSSDAFVIQNESDEIICYVEARPAGSSHPAVDQLPVDDVVAPGERRSLPLDASQDLALLDCNRHVIFARRGVNFSENGHVLHFYERE